MFEGSRCEAYDLAGAHESNPDSVWGYRAGLTRLSGRLALVPHRPAQTEHAVRP
jgi:hypothetical protein